MKRFASGFAGWVCAWGLIGCSSSDDAASGSKKDASIADVAHDTPPMDAGADITDSADSNDGADPHAIYPAFQPSVPQVITLGGPTLGDFNVVPVLYAGDSLAATVPDFLQKYAASSGVKAQLEEFGGGTMTIAPAITITDPAPATITKAEINTWLRAQLDGTHPEWGSNDAARLAKTIFLVVYPTGTVIVETSGAKSCGQMTGFHSVVPPTAPDDAGVVGAPILYAPIARCTAGALTEPQVLSLSIAHELIESVTDPFNAIKTPAYHEVDADHQAWGFVMGREVADLCSYEPFMWAPPDIGFTISRSWSNASASAYHDPCVPIPPGEPYFNSFIPATEDVSYAGGNTKGISVMPGETRKFEMKLFSDAPTSGPWTVYANEIPIGVSPQVLTLTLDGKTGQNGDTLGITISADASATVKHTIVRLISKLGNQQSLWFVWVTLV